MPTIDGIVVDGQIIDTIVMPNGEEISIGGITPEGTKTITQNGITNVTNYAKADVQVFPSLQKKSITITPSPLASVGTIITADALEYDGLSEVEVTVPRIEWGAEGTPTATKGTVSNHSVSVTPSVTNTAGYIPGSTKTGKPVTVSASELVSGTLSITSSGTKDVTNYASASVASGSATASATKGTVSNHSVIVTPSVTTTAGYVTAGTSSGTAVTVSASELASGNKEITSNGDNIDVVGYSTVSVNVTGGSTVYIRDTEDGAGGTIREITSDDQIIIDSLSVTSNGTYIAPSGTVYDEVSVNVSGGSSTPEQNYIYFIDYDGTILYTYTPAQINVMTSESDLPANPSHTGLTAQGWNWTLAQIKAQLTAMPTQDVRVGQMYITSSGDTEIDVVMTDGRLSPILSISVNGTVTVDWGDDTTANTVTGTSLNTAKSVPHTYAVAGSYTITIHVESGAFMLYGSSSRAFLYKNTTSAQNKVYSNCIRSVRFGNGITGISTYAFYYCYSMSNVTIPNTITSIGTYAFLGCYSLSNIVIPSGVTNISGNSIQECYNLTSVSLPSSITSIGTYAFRNNRALASISIPSGVTSIGSYAFYQCQSLKKIIIPSGVTSIAADTFGYCRSLSSITIPDTVTSIQSNAFQGCGCLSSIIIPDNVTSIGSYAFDGCASLEAFIIPSKLVSISSYMLSACYSLKSIEIPSGVTSIDAYAFQNCYALESITIPSTVTSIGTNAFNACYSLKSIEIPSGVTSIADSTFSTCNALTSIIIPNTVTSIGAYAFQNCYAIENITIPSTQTEITQYMFSYCYSLKSVEIPSGVTSIGTYAFQYCQSLQNIIIPSGVTAIKASAFNNCLGLSSMTIPSTVTSIGNNAFAACSGMKEYHFLSTTVPTAGSTIFSGIPSDCIIYVPAASLSDYQTATNWSAYASYMQGE